jgi:hypothetical protein
VTYDYAAALRPAVPAGGAHPEARSTWTPVDLAAALDPARPGETPPMLLARDDGVCLLYRQRVNSIYAEPETFKTWLALVAAVDELKAGNAVLWVDFEDSADTIVRRLRALAVPDDLILERFFYVRPDDPYQEPASTHALSPAVRAGATLAVIDGATEAFALHGLNPDKGPDVAKLLRLFPRPLADHGLAVVVIDHVVKAREQQGRWATGSGHKLAALSGAGLVMDTFRPFGHGLHGIARVSIAKDRPGRVREHATGRAIADLHLFSEPDGSVIPELRVPVDGRDEAGAFRPTVLMERVSRHLEAHPEGQSVRAISEAVTGKATGIRAAIDRLVVEQFARREEHGQAHRHYSVRPFRNDGEED